MLCLIHSSPLSPTLGLLCPALSAVTRGRKASVTAQQGEKHCVSSARQPGRQTDSDIRQSPRNPSMLSHHSAPFQRSRNPLCIKQKKKKRIPQTPSPQPQKLPIHPHSPSPTSPTSPSPQRQIPLPDPIQIPPPHPRENRPNGYVHLIVHEPLPAVARLLPPPKTSQKTPETQNR